MKNTLYNCSILQLLLEVNNGDGLELKPWTVEKHILIVMNFSIYD